MILVVLQYPALAPTVDELGRDKRQSAPFFETQIPGLIDKTWAMDEDSQRGISVYHFADRASADAWFDSERQRSFRREHDASIEFFEVGAVAVRAPLAPPAT